MASCPAWYQEFKWARIHAAQAFRPFYGNYIRVLEPTRRGQPFVDILRQMCRDMPRPLDPAARAQLYAAWSSRPPQPAHPPIDDDDDDDGLLDFGPPPSLDFLLDFMAEFFTAEYLHEFRARAVEFDRRCLPLGLPFRMSAVVLHRRPLMEWVCLNIDYVGRRAMYAVQHQSADENRAMAAADAEGLVFDDRVDEHGGTNEEMVAQLKANAAEYLAEARRLQEAQSESGQSDDGLASSARTTRRFAREKRRRRWSFPSLVSKFRSFRAERRWSSREKCGYERRRQHDGGKDDGHGSRI